MFLIKIIKFEDSGQAGTDFDKLEKRMFSPLRQDLGKRCSVNSPEIESFLCFRLFGNSSKCQKYICSYKDSCICYSIIKRTEFPASFAPLFGLPKALGRRKYQNRSKPLIYSNPIVNFPNFRL